MLIEGILRAQSGVVSRAQALATGLSEDQVDRRLAAGQWLTLHPRVYIVANREPTTEARIRAAGLWAGEAATITGLAAAWWHGLWPDPRSTIDITVSPTRGLRPVPGIRVRRRNLSTIDRVAVRGQWVTAVPLTVLEAAVTLGEPGQRLMDQALQRRVSYPALHRAYCRSLGSRGSAPAKRLLVAASDRAASVAERAAMSLLRSANLTGWRTHYHVDGYELDLAFPDNRVAIEIDGWAFHSDARSFQIDRQRQNALVLAGWTVLRFTWNDLDQRPSQVVGEIRAALGHDHRSRAATRADRG